MDASKQSRVPDQGRPQGSSSASAGTTSGVLNVRLWMTGEAGGSNPMFWKSAAPAVSLIVDLIAASEGVVATTQDNILVANFPSVQRAISAARRLQWAVQGFAEGKSFHGTAAAILVHSPEDQFGQTAGSSYLTLLNQAKPGQILLTDKTCQDLHDLPGFSLRAAPQAGLQELLWRAPEAESARSVDERRLAQLIEKQGVNAETEPEAPPVTTLAVGDLDTTASTKTNSENKSVLRAEPQPSPSGGKSPLLIGGACAAALLIVILIFALSHGKTPTPAVVASPVDPPVTVPKTQAVPSPVISGSPATPPVPAVNPPNPAPQNLPPTLSKAELRAAKGKHDKHGSSKLEPNSDENSEAESKPEPKPAVKPRGCDLDQQEIADEVETAERSLARGNYRDSERQFGEVLSCEPGNGRARAGLDRARKAETER